MVKNNKNQIFKMLFIAMAACLIYAIGSGIRANYGIMLTSISENSGVSYSSVSFVLAVAQLTFGIMQPVFGVVALKKSNAYVLCFGAIMVAVGLLMIPMCTSVWMLLLFLGIIMPAGTGALSFGIIMGAITPVLGQKMAATVSGFVSASSGLGSIVFSPLIRELLSNAGLMGCMIALSIPTLCLIPISIWLSKSSAKDDNCDEQKIDNTSLKDLLTGAISNKSYLLLLFAFFTCGFHMAIIETHLYTQMTTLGVAEDMAAYLFSIYGITTMLGSVFSGTLGSKVKMKWVAGTIFASRLFIILAFLMLPKTTVTIGAFALLLGFTGAATVPPVSGLVGKFFGSAKLATLFGIVFVSHQVGSFFSAWLGGICITATGSYNLIWGVSAVFSILAAIACFCVHEPEVA